MANAKEAFDLLEEGFTQLEAIYRKQAGALESVKDMAKLLRKLPTVNPALPTVSFTPFATFKFARHGCCDE